ncbi:hypothetical protein C8Q76DRAFT_710065 [Earliella scabrosa]|nr:hypothetical protein C8Q76DRAFT_710065 [Earliella scabrosa]
MRIALRVPPRPATRQRVRLPRLQVGVVDHHRVLDGHTGGVVRNSRASQRRAAEDFGARVVDLQVEVSIVGDAWRAGGVDDEGFWDAVCADAAGLADEVIPGSGCGGRKRRMSGQESEQRKGRAGHRGRQETLGEDWDSDRCSGPELGFCSILL